MDTHYIFLAKKWIFSQFLSATMAPSVALVSAPRITPSLNMIPAIVVPVFTAFGGISPLLTNNELLELKKKELG